LNASTEDDATSGNHAGTSPSPREVGSEPSRPDDVSRGDSRPVAMPNAEPTIEMMRGRLDSAIAAEAWAAVEVIQRRIDTLERASQPGAEVVQLDEERARRAS
jgi:hypothetical protein